MSLTRVKKLLVEYVYDLACMHRYANRLGKYHSHMHVYWQIKKLKTLNDLDKLKGIELKLLSQLQNCRDGKVDKGVERWRKTHKPNVENVLLLANIPGITINTAKSLIAKYGSISSIQDNPVIMKKYPALMYVKDLATPLTENEVKEVSKIFEDAVNNVHVPFKFTITGSYRRKNMHDMHDVDILISSEDARAFNELLDYLKLKDIIIFTHMGGKFRSHTICKLSKKLRRVDINFVFEKYYSFALIYHTGPIHFNLALNNIIKARSLKLTELGLQDLITGKYIEPSIELKDEKSIFDWLGIKYIEPKDRGYIDILSKSTYL